MDSRMGYLNERDSRHESTAGAGKVDSHPHARTTQHNTTHNTTQHNTHTRMHTHTYTTHAPTLTPCTHRVQHRKRLTLVLPQLFL